MTAKPIVYETSLSLQIKIEVNDEDSDESPSDLFQSWLKENVRSLRKRSRRAS
jgi:hypothetical protein